MNQQMHTNCHRFAVIFLKHYTRSFLDLIGPSSGSTSIVTKTVTEQEFGVDMMEVFAVS
jgi:hypothetical protein